MFRNTSNPASLRSAERRKREDEARRLADEVPTLKSLRIEVVEHVPTGTTKHVKLVVVARAPALFLIPCGDSDCRDEHDLTHDVMRALRARQEELRGTSQCQGTIRNGNCNRHISYRVLAVYTAAPPRGAREPFPGR